MDYSTEDGGLQEAENQSQGEVFSYSSIDTKVLTVSQEFPGDEVEGACAKGVQWTLETREGSVMARVRGKRVGKRPRFTYGHRGPITELSDGARLRLRESLLALRAEALAEAYFVTVTYHEYGGRSGATVRDDLRLFARWLVRHNPSCFGRWRAAYQERMVPHAHMIILGLPLLSEDEDREMREAWWLVSTRGEGDLAGIRWGLDAKRTEGEEREERVAAAVQAVYYMTRYEALSATPAATTDWGNGRWTGVIGQSNQARYEGAKREEPITAAEVEKLRVIAVEGQLERAGKIRHPGRRAGAIRDVHWRANLGAMLGQGFAILGN